MTRNTACRILNPVLAVLTVNQGVTAILMGRMTGKNFWIFHEILGVILLILIVIHFVLNLHWVKANYFCKTCKKEDLETGDTCVK